MISIVDYGLGNLRSIQNMLWRAGVRSTISSDPNTLRGAERLILPGVGHFRYGMDMLRQRKLLGVLNERALDAKVPVLGICLGAQLLGRHSQEGNTSGLGWLAMDTVAFNPARLTGGEKIPHMGWADTHCINHPLFANLSESAPRFYYVHSFHFSCDDPQLVICDAMHGYSFASGVAKDNIIGIQFHPEKSSLLWPAVAKDVRYHALRSMRRIRVIPVLLLADRGMVKTHAFAKPRYLGDPINAVKIFNEKMTDELILLDIEATSRGKVAFDWIEDIVSEAFMPVAYGGGLNSLHECARLLACGVEKVIINTAAVERPALISEISERFGAQAAVVSIDARRNLWKQWKAYIRGARKETKFSPVELAQTCARLGAGEIFLTVTEREGAFGGFDLDVLKSVTSAVSVPVIAHGGAGKMGDFLSAVVEGGASAVAAGSMFVFAAKGEGMLISYPGQEELKNQFWNRIPA